MGMSNTGVTRCGKDRGGITSASGISNYTINMKDPCSASAAAGTLQPRIRSMGQATLSSEGSMGVSEHVYNMCIVFSRKRARLAVWRDRLYERKERHLSFASFFVPGACNPSPLPLRQ